MNRPKKLAALIGGAILTVAALAGCSPANPPSAFCGWIQGDGSQDSRVHQILLPNDNARAGADEKVKYVPCNSRNYIITDGAQKGVNGDVTGDSSQPVIAYTADKTQVAVALSAFWTLNEGRDSFTNFIALCQKYNCAQEGSDDNNSQSNFGTKGWNGMLAENFYPSIRAAVQDVTPQFGNAMWQNGGDATKRKEYADAISADFMKQIQQTTGYNTDLFCGSGNSRFTDNAKTAFNCTNVRFRIDQVAAKDASVQKNLNVESQSQQIIDANKARLKQAQALYGDQAPYWLGLHDAAAGCAPRSTCQFLIKPAQ